MSRSDKVESYYLQSIERLSRLQENSNLSSAHVYTRASEHTSSFVEDITHRVENDHTESSLVQPTDEEFVSILGEITEHLDCIEKKKAVIVEILESQVEEGLPLPFESQKKMLSYVESCTELFQNIPQYQAALQFGSDSDWEQLNNITSPSLESELGSQLQSALHLLKTDIRALEKLSQLEINDCHGKSD